MIEILRKERETQYIQSKWSYYWTYLFYKLEKIWSFGYKNNMLYKLTENWEIYSLC
jgi:hypothetical protein